MIWNTSKALVNWRGWKLRSESLHESFLNFHAPVKREQELHESWEARVCMTVFSALMPRSNENKSCMRVEKRECVWEFSQLSCPGQTRTIVAWELMRVEKREFAWEFSQLSCPGQTRTRVAWELRSESLHESFLNSHALVKREQELHESWWELRSESLHESFLNSHALVKREQELHESWEARVCIRVFSALMSREVKREQEFSWELRSESLHDSFLSSHAPVKREQELHESWEARVCMRVFPTLMPRSNENKSCMRVDASWEARVCMRVFSTLMPRSNENNSCMRVDWILPIVAKTLVNSYQNLNQLKLD